MMPTEQQRVFEEGSGVARASKRCTIVENGAALQSVLRNLLDNAVKYKG